MKKIFYTLLLGLVFLIPATAQKKYSIQNQLQLSTVPLGSPNDSIMVVNSQGAVSYIPKSSISGGGSTPSLQQVLLTGNQSSQNLIIQEDIEEAGDGKGVRISDGGVNVYNAENSRYVNLSNNLIQVYNGNDEKSININNTSIYSNQPIGKENRLIFTRDSVGEAYYRFPEKSAGNYTLATLEDISGGSVPTFSQMITASTDPDNIRAEYAFSSGEDYRALGFTDTSEFGITQKSTFGSSSFQTYMVDSSTSNETSASVQNDGVYLTNSFPASAKIVKVLVDRISLLDAFDSTAHYLNLLYPTLRDLSGDFSKTIPLSSNGIFSDDSGNINLGLANILPVGNYYTSGGSTININSSYINISDSETVAGISLNQISTGTALGKGSILYSDGRIAISSIEGNAGTQIFDSNSTTEARVLTLPDNDGIIPISVNRNFAGTDGNIITVATNSTTSALSTSTLNTAYTGVGIGFRVQCSDITGGALVYEKTASGWIQYGVTITP
ncbi:hypothetical protein GKZ90_0012500 [Flavobacterium sp. MC2016-06]|jgi:hypothetical protein|uniref:hypothetical protein n=1 Tax=Flavobacterium sp. MC2016-06 TaxID=2676308 RepID=UPI0012BA8926|nr:hypothetical protein [Flavobacterium sp. MC2016-06]MBU3860130.1 hypothetical protein [Flavobacterium sp. MC2016-06]